MQVGVYFDMRNPKRWRRDPRELYGAFPELCEEAERVGLDSVWVTEHHGFDDDYLPSPLTMLAAAAVRTTRVRLGTGIVVAPLHPAAELAEQAAVVDLLSGGRLDLGLGAGYRPTEFALYGADMATRYRANDERAQQIRALWANGEVTPGPAQERLPIWMGYLGPKGARRAGRLGEYLLAPDARLWPHYRAGLEEAGHDPAVGRMGGGVQAWATDDPERDWPMVSEHLAHQLNSYRMHARMVDVDVVRARRPRGFNSLDYFVYGTPGEVAEFVHDFSAGAPVDNVYFWGALPGMTHEQIMRNIQLIGAELAPLVRAGADLPAAVPGS